MKILKILEESFNERVKSLEELIYFVKFTDTVVQSVEIDKMNDGSYLLDFYLETTKIGTQYVNNFYGEVANALKESGFTDSLNEFKIKISDLIFIGENRYFKMGWRKFIPTHIINEIKFRQPTISRIERGEYSVVLPDNPVTNNSGVDVQTMINIKRKRAETFFKIYQKGTVIGHQYSLMDNPIIKVDYLGGYSNTLNIKYFRPEIIAVFETIDNSKDYDNDLLKHISEALNKKFKQHEIYFTHYT
jgi:hypothetical protein